jgi:hypothetical protein
MEELSIEQIKKHCCNELLGLYLNDPLSNDKYISAFSFDKNILANMVDIFVETENKEYYSIEPIELLLHYKDDDSEKLEKFFNIKNVKGILLNIGEINFEDLEFPIYRYNKIINNECKQVLLCTEHSNEKKFQLNGISENPIQIDTFYEESVIKKNIKKHCCNQLKGLYLTDPQSNDKYISAFSFDTNVLKNMIDTFVEEIEKQYYSIDNIKLLQHLKLKKPEQNDKLDNSIDGKEKYKDIICDGSDLIFENLEFPIYGYNFIKNDNCEQVLLCTNYPNEKYFESNGISYSPIQIDTFYDESILNA